MSHLRDISLSFCHYKDFILWAILESLFINDELQICVDKFFFIDHKIELGLFRLPFIAQFRNVSADKRINL